MHPACYIDTSVSTILFTLLSFPLLYFIALRSHHFSMRSHRFSMRSHSHQTIRSKNSCPPLPPISIVRIRKLQNYYFRQRCIFIFKKNNKQFCWQTLAYHALACYIDTIVSTICFPFLSFLFLSFPFLCIRGAIASLYLLFSSTCLQLASQLH